MNKQQTIEFINDESASAQHRRDLALVVKAAFLCKVSAIDLIIEYCDANGLTYSSDLSTYVLNNRLLWG